MALLIFNTEMVMSVCDFDIELTLYYRACTSGERVRSSIAEKPQRDKPSRLNEDTKIGVRQDTKGWAST